MKVASSIVLNIERARETGELDYLALWQLDLVVKLCALYNFDNFAEVQYNMVITLS